MLHIQIPPLAFMGIGSQLLLKNQGSFYLQSARPKQFADAQEIFQRYITDYGPFENQLKIFAQRPPALRHVMGLLLELADEAVLPKRYLEIALVTVSKLNDCQYCVAHHGPRMTR